MNRQQRRAAAKQGSRSGTAGRQSIAEGLGHHREGRLDQASALYLQALEADPNDVDALHLLGLVRRQQGDPLAAIALIEKAIAVKPGFSDAHRNRGDILRDLGRLSEAEASFREALRLQPAYVAAHNNLAVTLRDLGRPAEAEAACREALRLRPDYPEAHNNLGVILRDLDRLVEAEASFREAVRQRPDYVEAHSNLGATLRDLGRPAEAAASHRAALWARGSYAEAHCNLGNALRDLNHLAEAEASFREALRLRPDYADAHNSLALLLLSAGRLEEGWEEYEWRWKTRHLAAGARQFAAPRWNGEAIGNRVILLYAEQGLGDTLQFCRYVPPIAAGAGVVFEVQAPLVRLLSRLPGVREVVARGRRLPPFDLQCPLLSLPRAVGTRLDTIPADIPYLTADPADMAAWRQRLGRLDGLRVGLVWAGGRRLNQLELAPIDRRRSIALAAMAPFADVPGISLVSLQKGEPAAQAADPPRGMALHDFTADLQDFADTAALVANLDLVISVDTAVAHLAGGLGIPVWLLNRFDTDWRWLLDRDDNPWYPQLRQFRQPSPGDWDSVIREARDALRRLAAGDRDQLRPRSALIR